MNSVEKDSDSNQSDGHSPLFIHYGAHRGRLFWLLIVNAVLTILTLGIYRFWGRTRLRRYLWSSVTINDDPVEYTGTPWEMFRGFLVVLVFAVPIFLLLSFFGIGLNFNIEIETDLPIPGLILPIAVILFFSFISALFSAVVALAEFLARRYRLARTRWRGIQFAQDGRALDYVIGYCLRLFVAYLTLGLAYPWVSVWRKRYLWNHTRIGNQTFRCNAATSDVMSTWLIAWFTTPLTFGLVHLWYRAVEFRYVTSKLSLNDLQFNSRLNGGSVVFSFIISSILTTIFMAIVFFVGFSIYHYTEIWLAGGSIGVPLSMDDPSLGLVVLFIIYAISYPVFFVFFWHSVFRNVVDTLTINGTIDLDDFQQQASQGDAKSEGLLDVLDVGSAF